MARAEEVVEKVVERLQALSSAEYKDSVGRFAVDVSRSFGVKVPILRKMARELGRSHELAEALWEVGVRETRLLASMVEEPEKVSREQADRWAEGFWDWEICDGVCVNLFVYLPFAREKAVEWAGRKEEFVKRAGFSLMAIMAWKGKNVEDEVFEEFLKVIERESTDGRTYVKKAVSWALRQIGKRNARLHRKAVEVAERLAGSEDRTARWIGNSALRELLKIGGEERQR